MTRRILNKSGEKTSHSVCLSSSFLIRLPKYPAKLTRGGEPETLGRSPAASRQRI